ncbi:MAG: right-handed parallel beta-helix repeat-containing protein [Candidatus Hodarchaeales archaeon]|jgi:parallel beta-helix repeat protein
MKSQWKKLSQSSLSFKISAILAALLVLTSALTVAAAGSSSNGATTADKAPLLEENGLTDSAFRISERTYLSATHLKDNTVPTIRPWDLIVDEMYTQEGQYRWDETLHIRYHIQPTDSSLLARDIGPFQVSVRMMNSRTGLETTLRPYKIQQLSSNSFELIAIRHAGEPRLTGFDQVIFEVEDRVGHIQTVERALFSPPVDRLERPDSSSAPDTTFSDSKRAVRGASPLGGLGTDYPPPNSGDWVISNPTIVYDETILLNGSIRIQSGGNLTLQNATLRMNNAVTGAYNITIDNGGVLHVVENSTITAANPSKAWYLNATAGSITFLKNSTFSYAGWEYDHSGLIISSTGAKVINSTFQHNYAGLQLYQADNSLVTGNSIWNSSGGVGIAVRYSENCIIRDNTISNSSNSGIWLDGSLSTTVSHNFISNSSAAGIANNYSENSTIFSNTIWNTNLTGLFNPGCLYAEVYNNTVLHSSLGIGLWFSNHSTIYNNTITNSSTNGVLSSSNSEYNTFSENIIINSSLNGFYLRFSSNSTLDSNNVTFSGGDGIYLNNSHYITISNNIVKNNTIGGIGLNESDHSIIFNNTIAHSFDTSNGNGIRLFHSNYSQVSDNHITYSQASGLVLGFSRNATFTQNTVFDRIILWYTENSVVSGNKVPYSDSHGIYLNYSPNTTISDNIIANDSHTGIYLNSSSECFVDRNTVTNSTYDGIGLYWSDLCVVSNNVVTRTEIFNGIYITSSSNAIVTRNTLANNTNYGIGLSTTASSNVIYLNNILDNNWGQAYDDNGANSFYFNTVGNYWGSAYTGTDTDGDGIGETPYTFPGNQDLYPLVFAVELLQAPIFINNNLDFEMLGFPGSGTPGDPYIIAGYNITFATTTLIHIQDTTKYFIVRDNWLDGIGGSYYGIYLQNAIHGAIDNNTIRHGSNGIFLASSAQMNITYNQVYENLENGIVLQNSNWTYIGYNTVYENGNATISWYLLATGGSGHGIYLDPSNYNTITHNTIYSNDAEGIFLYLCERVTISYNEIYENALNGIFLQHSNNNTLLDNTIYDNGNSTGGGRYVLATGGSGHGIYLDPSNYNTITQNTIYSNDGSGVFLENSNSNTISDNTIYDNGNGNSTGGGRHVLAAGGSGHGIYLDPSIYNVITNNWVYGNLKHGIVLENSDKTEVLNNIIMENGLYGINITEGSSDNTIQGNDFYNNNPEGTSQALDDGTDNQFSGNYWSDHDNIDNNGDGIADWPYLIDGTASNHDNSAVIMPNWPTSSTHFLPPPRVAYPNGGEQLSGVISIRWAYLLDPLDHSITYTAWYSPNNGDTWTRLGTGISTNEYSWDTRLVPNGDNYLVKIVATCSAGYTSVDTSDEPFTIWNPITSEPEPTPSSRDDDDGGDEVSPGWALPVFLAAIITLIGFRRFKRKSE